MSDLCQVYLIFVRQRSSVNIFITIQTYKNIINVIRIKSIRTSRHILFLLYIFLDFKARTFLLYIILGLGAYNNLDWKIEHASKSNDQHLTYMFNWREHYAIIKINFVFGYYHVHAELKATAILTRLFSNSWNLLYIYEVRAQQTSGNGKLKVPGKLQFFVAQESPLWCLDLADHFDSAPNYNRRKNENRTNNEQLKSKIELKVKNEHKTRIEQNFSGNRT